MARCLAMHMATAVLGAGSDKAVEMARLYAAELPQAHEATASEEKHRPEPDSWLMARGYEGGWFG